MVRHFEVQETRESYFEEATSSGRLNTRNYYFDVGSNSNNNFDVAKEIEVKSKYLIFNPDNTRIRGAVLSHLNTGSLADNVDSIDSFYQTKNDQDTQDFLYQLLLERALSGRKIYRELKKVGFQSDPLLVDHEGIVIDGNRRLATMIHLYNDDPETYSNFENIKCHVLPYKQDNRRNNEKHETLLHNAEDLQEPHSWIDVALTIYTKKNSRENPIEVSALAKEYRTSSPKIYEHCYTADGIDDFIKFLKANHPTGNDFVDIYESILEMDVKQDFKQVALYYKTANDNPEQALTMRKKIECIFYILSTVNDGESNGIDIIGDRKYSITSSKNLLPVVEELLGVSNECTFVEFQEKISELSKVTPENRDSNILQIVEQIEQITSLQDAEDLERYVLDKLEKFESDITSLTAQVTPDTCGALTHDASKRSIKKINKSLDKILKKIERIEG